MRRATATVAALVALSMLGPTPSTAALQTDQESVANTITADTLDPPTNVQCNGGLFVCNAGLIGRPALTWTATPDPYATGYRVYRSTTSGSGYTQVATVSGRTTTSWTDTTGGLAVLTTYYYVLRAESTNWTSALSNEVAVTILIGL